MYLSAVRTSQWLDNDISVPLVLHNVVAYSGDTGTVVPLCLTTGLRMVGERRHVPAVEADHSVLDETGCDL